MTALAWKRDKKLGHVATVGGRKVARIVRLSARAWRWSYRGPGQTLAIHGEARILKHAKAAVGELHASKSSVAPKAAVADTGSVRAHLGQLKTIVDDVMAEYCETCRMAPCVCARPRTATHQDCQANDPADAVRTRMCARNPVSGEGPRGGQFRDRERPDYAEQGGMPAGPDGLGPERVRDPHPAAPRETARGAAPSPQLSLLNRGAG